MRHTQVTVHLYPDVSAVALPLTNARTAVERLFWQQTQQGFSVFFVDGQGLQRQDSSGIGTSELAADFQGLGGLPAATDGVWSTRLLVAQSSSLIHPTAPVGVMFDEGKRSGCAVFASTIANSPRPLEPLLARTIAHELGHVFNLAHEDGSGNDIMSGGFPTVSEVQNPAISPANVHHLVEHDEASVRPGHNRFLTRTCLGHPVAAGGVESGQATGQADPRTRRPRRKISLRLRINAGTVYPRTGAPTFVIGEPIHLTVEVHNGSGRAVLIPRGADTANQHLVVQRLDSHGCVSLMPPLLYCGGAHPESRLRLEPGRTGVFHETLLFRGGELVFPREGSYRLVAGLRLGSRWLVSEPQTARVAPPLNRRHEQSCEAASDPAAGLFIELGGAEWFDRAVEQLERLDHTNPKFPLNRQAHLVAGRMAVLAPGRTSAKWRRRLDQLVRNRSLPAAPRAEAELLLRLDRAQGGDRQASAWIERRLGDDSRLPISFHSAALIRRQLAELKSSHPTEEP